MSLSNKIKCFFGFHKNIFRIPSSYDFKPIPPEGIKAEIYCKYCNKILKVSPKEEVWVWGKK
jgi:hypothetical protein